MNIDKKVVKELKKSIDVEKREVFPRFILFFNSNYLFINIHI